MLPVDDSGGGGNTPSGGGGSHQSSPTPGNSYSTSALLGLDAPSSTTSSSTGTSTPAPPSWLIQAPEPKAPVAPPTFLEGVLSEIKERAKREPKKALEDTADELGMTAGALTTVPGMDPTLRADRGRLRRPPTEHGARRQKAIDLILGALTPDTAPARDPITGRQVDRTPDPVTLEPDPRYVEARFSDKLAEGKRTGGFTTDPQTGEKVYYVKTVLDDVVHPNETSQLAPNKQGVLKEVPFTSGITGLSTERREQLEDREVQRRSLRRQQPRDNETGRREKHGDVTPMTWDEYNALSPRQRAAVDFNTMLVQAVRKDKRLQDTYDPTEDQQAAYDERISSIFGYDGGSKRFAPETLSVLQQVGYRDESMDLDDFLGLRTAITSRDIRNFGKVEDVASTQSSHRASDNLVGNETLQPALEIRNELVTELVDGTLNFQEQLAEGDQMLQNFRATAMLDRNDDLQFYGGFANEPKVGFGWQPLTDADFTDPVTGAYGVPQNDNAYFNYAFEQLANANPVNPVTGEPLTHEQLVSVINQDLANREVPGLLEKFWGYVDRRSAQSYQGGKPLGIAEGTEYRTPEEFRQLLGLEPKREARHAR